MNRDFESQFYLFSKSNEFNKRLKKEIDSEFHNFKKISLNFLTSITFPIFTPV